MPAQGELSESAMILQFSGDMRRLQQSRIHSPISRLKVRSHYQRALLLRQRR
jgi:hypothetical protein